MNKFEKLIEYVINDEHEKARELFHDIVVEKSRNIYEDLMEEDDDLEGIEADEEGEEEEFDDEEEGEEEESGDEEEGEEEFDDSEFDDSEFDDDSDEGDLEDRVVDLEDQLDELMAEFESLMGDDEDMGDDFGDEEMGDDFGDEDMGDDFGDDMGGDDLAVDDTEEFDMMAENLDLTPVPKVSNSEESWVNKKSSNADNSGAIGAVAKPVRTDSGNTSGRSDPKVGNLPDAGSFKNVPAKGNSKLTAVPKPSNSQASGVNSVTPFPKV